MVHSLAHSHIAPKASKASPKHIRVLLGACLRFAIILAMIVGLRWFGVGWSLEIAGPPSYEHTHIARISYWG